DSRKGRNRSPPALASLGGAVGVVSSLTGTGGPVVLVPLLLWLRVPVLTAVGLSQTVQVPIATLATIGHLWTGHFDLRLAGVLAIGIAVGSAVGARIAHAIPTLALARLVAIVLVWVGLLVPVRWGN